MKKLISGIVLFALLLGMAMPGMAENQVRSSQMVGLPDNAVEVAPNVYYLGEKIRDGKVVEGYAFIHSMESAATSKQAKDNDVDLYEFLPRGIKWADTMTYKLDPYACDDLNQEDIIYTISASLTTWNSELPVESPLFNVDGLEIIDSTQHQESNGEDYIQDSVNAISWGNLGTSGIIAMNIIWSTRTTKQIVESDVIFNTNYDWTTKTTDEGCSNQMDLQGIATHEFGHNGLSDLYFEEAYDQTMFGRSYYCDDKKRTLESGDIAGIVALYG